MPAVDWELVTMTLRDKLIKGIDNLPQVAYENRNSRPEDGKQPTQTKPEMMIEEALLPGAQPRSSTGFIEGTGMMTYMVKVPIGTGTTKVRDMAMAIAALFTPPQSLVFNGITVTVERSEQMPGGPDGEPGKAAWYQVPVYITFRVYVDCLVG